MNRLVTTALALAAVGSAANAAPGDNEWLELDSEINGLSTSLTPAQDGMGWAALIRAVYSHSKDDIATGGGGAPDLSGFTFNDVDLAFWSNYGPYLLRISADIDSNEAGLGGASFELEDAYVQWNCEYFDAILGNFKCRVSRSNSLDPENLLFIDRTTIGSAFDAWDNGIGGLYYWEQLLVYAAVFNGFNGHTEGHSYVLRGEWKLGDGAGDIEGAMGSSDTLNATAGFTMVNDDTVDDSPLGTGDLDGDGDTDNLIYILDFNGKISQFGFGAEVASLDNDFAAVTDEDYSNISDSGLPGALAGAPGLGLAPDSLPWNATFSYLLNEEWEFGFRYEDLDNSEFFASGDGPDNTVMSLVVNWRRDPGAGKWQAEWTEIDADSGFPDGSILEVGYSIGRSR